METLTIMANYLVLEKGKLETKLEMVISDQNLSVIDSITQMDQILTKISSTILKIDLLNTYISNINKQK